MRPGSRAGQRPAAGLANSLIGWESILIGMDNAEREHSQAEDGEPGQPQPRPPHQGRRPATGPVMTRG